MKAYLWKTDRAITPFRDAVGDALIGNVPLRIRQREALESAGLTVAECSDPAGIRDPDFLLIRDDLYFSAEALRRFLEGSKDQAKSCACALDLGPFTEFTKFLQDLRSDTDPVTGAPVLVYGMYRCRGPVASREAIDSIAPLTIEAKQVARPVEPGTFLPESMSVSFTPAFSDALLMHVCHWAHIWLLNLLVLRATLKETFMADRFGMVLRAASALSFNRQKIASRFVIKGRKCNIHPSAVVQACILGDNVRIGPHAVVRGCILGDGVRVDDQSLIYASVFGEKSFTCPRGFTKLSVVYPGACAGRMQGCVVGRNAFMASLAHFFDLKFEGTVKVRHEGRIVDTGLNFLSVCVGHDAVVGADFWLAAGREIPNGAVLVKNPRDIASSIPADLPSGEPAVVRNSTVITLRELADRADGEAQGGGD